jgi:hypothetical protein
MVSASNDVLPDRDRAVLDAWLAKPLRAMQVRLEPKVVALDEEPIPSAFPACRIYAVYFPRWPVAVRLPKELAHETLACVHGKSVTAMRDRDALRTFVSQQVTGVHDDTGARRITVAVMRLAAAAAKGGPYRIGDPEVSVEHRDDALVTSARTTVPEPARGTIAVRLEFGAGGSLAPDAVTIDSDVHPGPPSY